VKKFFVFWISIVTLFLLGAPTLLAHQGLALRHRQGEIWMSCAPEVPVVDIGQAFIDAAVRQYRTGQLCRIKQQRGRWIFRHTQTLEEQKRKR